MKKKKTCSTPTLIRVWVALAVLVGVVLNVSPAFAGTYEVSGTDYFYTEENKSPSVDVLTVTGDKGDTVYINLKKGDEYLAKCLEFTLDGENAQLDANNNMVGAVSLEFNGEIFSYDDTYTIEVYSSRYEKPEDLKYTGTISTLRAWFDDVKKSEPLVVRTLKDGENRELAIPKTKSYNGVDYELASEEQQEIDGKKYYVYKPASNLAESVEGHVNYYDANHNVLRSDAVQIAKGETKDVSIPAVFSVDGDKTMYRSLTLADKVTLSYPGVTEFDINCMQLSDQWGKAYYKAVINYVDADNKPLSVVDQVVVNKKYLYTPPSLIYVTDKSGKVQEYSLKSENPSLNSQGVLELQPDGKTEGTVEYNIVYEPVAENAERTWTVVLVNGSAAPKDANREFGRITYKGAPGKTVKFNPTDANNSELTSKVNLTDYEPAASSANEISHTFGVADMDVEQTVYYVPNGFVAPEAYDITVKYVNVANNQVISTETYTASPSMRSDLEIKSPAEFSQSGVDWVKLGGQESPIRHSFYDAAREYVVYYRDVNDDQHINTVIRTVRVVYVDEQGNTVTRPTTIVVNGTNETGDAGTGAAAATTDAAAGAAETTDTGLQTGTDLLSIDNGDSSGLVTQDGTDLATTRIEDEETPLAASPNQGAAKVGNETALIAGGIGVAVAAALGLLFFFIYKRRKQGNDESSDDDITA